METPLLQGRSPGGLWNYDAVTQCRSREKQEQESGRTAIGRLKLDSLKIAPSFLESVTGEVI